MSSHRLMRDGYVFVGVNRIMRRPQCSCCSAAAGRVAMVENETLRTVISGTAAASHRYWPHLSTRSARAQAAPAGAYRGACTARASRKTGGRSRSTRASHGPRGPGAPCCQFGVYGARPARSGAATWRGRSRRTRSSRPAAPPRRQRPGAGARRAGPELLQVAAGGRRRAPRRAASDQQVLAGQDIRCHAGPARGGGGGRRLPRPRGHAASGRAGSRRVLCGLRGHAAARGGAPGLAEAGARCGASIELSRR